MEKSWENIWDFKWYSRNVLKIQTKINGLMPFKLRRVQEKYVDHLKEAFPDNIIRSIVLKPRQSGFSTLVAGINMHKTWTRFDEKGIMLADKLARTKEVFSIYDTFRKNMPVEFKPRQHTKDIVNSEEMYFETLRSGFKSETSNDPNAGRSGSRRWAHLTEFAFYANADSIDEGVQNSIPIASGTRIFKESTAYGMDGVGRSFYQQWEAACRGESIYKPFFVSWIDVEDYSINPTGKLILTSHEKELMKMHKDITIGNLNWRRLKLSEYASGSEQIYSPEDRMKQDFPLTPEEAFLSSGRPVFDQDKLLKHIHDIGINKPTIIKINVVKPHLSMFKEMLSVFKTPDKSGKYIVGADIAEGLSSGDFSSAFVMSKDGRQVALFHGHIDPDLFGRVLVEIATIYNEALIVPEMNSIGFATLSSIKNAGYTKVYHRDIVDEIGLNETPKLGWRTTSSSKQTMLSKLIAMYRDGEIEILDINLLKEMKSLTRESNGNVELNSKDRVVAACLACMGLTQVYEPATVYNPSIKSKITFETKDLYRDKRHKNIIWKQGDL